MIDRPLEADLAMKRKNLEEHLETAIQDENDFLIFYPRMSQLCRSLQYL